jgi:hypothetical protein
MMIRLLKALRFVLATGVATSARRGGVCAAGKSAARLSG